MSVASRFDSRVASQISLTNQRLRLVITRRIFDESIALLEPHFDLVTTKKICV